MSKVFNMVGGGGKNISSIVITGLKSTDTVTCTKDGKTYPATWDDTAQHWEIVGLPLGTFTVTATNGTNTSTETVLIDTIGVYEIEMDFKFWLYRDGDECEEITGGWSNYSDTSKLSLSTLVKNNDNLYSQNDQTYGLAGTGNLIDLTNYSTLYAEIKTGTGGNSYGWVGSSVVTAKEWYQETDNPPAFALFQQGSIACDTTKYSLDVSALSGSYYVTIVDYVKSFNIYKVWLE